MLAKFKKESQFFKEIITGIVIVSAHVKLL